MASSPSPSRGVSARSSVRARTRPSPVPPPIDDSGSEAGETSSEGHQRLRENRKTDERFAFLAMALVGMVIVFCFSTVIYLSYFQGSGSSVSGPRDSRQRASHPSGRKVKDSQRQLSISLADAYTGTKMEIAVPHRVLCPKCGGLGHDPDVAPKQCPVCHGTGSQTFVQRFGRTTRKFRSTCQHCHGRGQVVGQECPVCHGHQRITQKDKFKLAIKPGSMSGDTIRVPRGGDQHPDADPGDLVVHLLVSDHPVFVRKGDDLHTELVVSLTEALLGFTRSITHLDKHDVPVVRSGVTQHDEVIHIRGEGMPRKSDATSWGGLKFGDLFVRIRVRFPRALTTAQVAAVERLLPEPGESGGV